MEWKFGINPEEWAQIKRWSQHFPELNYACVHHIFEQEVDKHPDAPAVCAWDGELTYDELDCLSTKLGAHLVGLGVKSGCYVPFYFEKSMWTVVATAGILKAGGAYVPLDPSHPQERIASIIGDVGAKLVLASPSCAARIADLPIKVVSVSAKALSLLDPVSQAPAIEVRPADPVLIFFTSGSTGRPKGIVLQHAAIATNARSNALALGIDSDSRVLQFAAHGWDIATLDMWTTLMRGGCVCVPSEQDRQSDVTGAMERMRVNWVLFTPSFVELVSPAEVPHLKTLVIAGEPMKQAIITKWADHVRLFNAYGPAETGICTVARYGSGSGRAESIGRQITSNVCWIVDVDDHEKLVPIGSVGELLVEGPNLALGYLNDEAKTKAAFIENPVWLRSDRIRKPRRLYKTGDLVKYQPDGSIDFVGRKDYQLKIRGQRLELGEIEGTVETHPAVLRALVSYPQDGRFKKCLVLVLQPTNPPAQQEDATDQICPLADEPQSSSQSLRQVTAAFLAERLPPHMLPDFIVPVRALPLSSSAKIDRKRVEAWLLSISAEDFEVARSNRGSKTSHPLTPEHGTAFRIGIALAEIINSNHSNKHDVLLRRHSFLRDLGVDSIQYIKILMFIRRTWGISVPLSKLIGHQTTIADLANYIDNDGRDSQQSEQSASAVILLDEFHTHLKGLVSYAQNLPARSWTGRNAVSTVFITGSTGFLGTQILWRLLMQPSVKRVIAHVRADDEDQGFQRVLQAARNARWWRDEFSEKLEVWPGDLKDPRLGLSEEQWNCLRGQGQSPVDAIIHNGAKVHWMEDYHTLKATNVESTLELLRVALDSSSVSRFVYISGGELPSALGKDDRQRVQEAINFNGYAETKLVSELLVREIGRHEQALTRRNRFSAVKPGYIIGPAREEIADPNSFLWRLAAGAVEVNGYNTGDHSSFLFISSTDQVSHEVLRCCVSSDADSRPVHAILDGLEMEEFWTILRLYFRDMQPMKEDDWLCSLREATVRTGESHPLYPCLHMIEDKKMKVGEKVRSGDATSTVRKVQIQAAIKSSLKYLSDRGYLPRPRIPLHC